MVDDWRDELETTRTLSRRESEELDAAFGIGPERDQRPRRRRLAPGKRTLTQRLGGRPLQLKEARERQARLAAAWDSIGTTAQEGVTGAGAPLPFAEQIQASFGPDHDVSGIRAHVGSESSRAAQAIGAAAYATGNDVAFAHTPDLHTAAHEAAHVMQQRQGVHLNGGVGQAGDVHEMQADQVADAVVRGESANC